MLLAAQTIDENVSLSSSIGGLIMQYRWWVVGFVVALLIFNAFRLHIQNRMKEEEKPRQDRWLPK